ncbi:MAG: T9SS type A sorting domain-containing protein [Candidatus Kapabacteria bacterium]|nr:T9SS type A sorting domain-containing protein [Candidatus Kapabacteria bacterium]
MTNGTGNVSTLAGLNDAFAKGSTFNPAPKANSTFLTSANFADLSDTFYDKVAYRGANGLQRWDAGWVEYDPINKDYVVTGVEEDMVSENKLEVNISPLPANDYTTVRYFIPTNSNVSVKFFNATGSIASTYFENENQITGYYEFNLSTKDLSAGVYYLVVTTEFGSITKKVVVVK